MVCKNNKNTSSDVGGETGHAHHTTLPSPQKQLGKRVEAKHARPVPV